MSVIHVWVLLSAAGLLLSLILSRESILDLRALPNQVNGRRIAARARLAREALRASVHAVYLAIGLPILDREVELTLVVLGLMWGNLVLVVNSLIDARTRYLLYATRDSEPDLSP